MLEYGDEGMAKGVGRGVEIKVAEPDLALNNVGEVGLEIATERFGFTLRWVLVAKPDVIFDVLGHIGDDARSYFGAADVGTPDEG